MAFQPTAYRILSPEDGLADAHVLREATLALNLDRPKHLKGWGQLMREVWDGPREHPYGKYPRDPEMLVSPAARICIENGETGRGYIQTDHVVPRNVLCMMVRASRSDKEVASILHKFTGVVTVTGSEHRRLGKGVSTPAAYKSDCWVRY